MSQYAQFVRDKIDATTRELQTLQLIKWQGYIEDADSKSIFAKWALMSLIGKMGTKLKEIRWLESVDKMRLMTGEAQYTAFREESLIITAFKYQTGLQLSVDEIEDNLENDYTNQVMLMNEAAKRLSPELIHGLLINGVTDNGYDGVPFFSDAHPLGSSTGTFDNLLVGALSETTLNAGKVAMMKFPNDRGDILGLEPNLIVIPPDLEVTLKKLLNSQYTNAVATVEGANTINTAYGAFDYIIDPLLTDTNDWYMIHTKMLKPFLHYERKAPYLEKDENERVSRDIVKWSLKYRIGVGYGWPQSAIKFVI
jgi:phage major head subunit gpT-like protein